MPNKIRQCVKAPRKFNQIQRIGDLGISERGDIAPRPVNKLFDSHSAVVAARRGREPRVYGDLAGPAWMFCTGVAAGLILLTWKVMMVDGATSTNALALQAASVTAVALLKKYNPWAAEDPPNERPQDAPLTVLNPRRI